MIYYRVDDIRAAFEALSAARVPFEGEPHLIAKMPNAIGLMSEVKRLD
ncbi:MAG: hypothetical protein ABIZ80_13850 [Bryobacteraceae bacterium]